MKDLKKEMNFSENRLTTLGEIQALAIQLLNETWKIDLWRNHDGFEINLLDRGWSFEFNNRKQAAGLCSKNDKKIYISKWLLQQNLDKSLEFENTLRHELAHALDFEIRGTSNHDRVWKFIARQVLSSDERCYTNEQISVTATTKYTLICDTCKKEVKKHKVNNTRPRACASCCKEHNFGRFSEKYVFRQVQNY